MGDAESAAENARAVETGKKNTQGISGNRRLVVGDGSGVGRLRRHRREETHTLPGEGLFLSMPITN